MLTIFGYTRPAPMWETDPPPGGTPPPPADPPGPKMVPESDLLAVKAQGERARAEVATLKATIDQLQRDGGATKAQLETLQAELATAKETVQEVEQLRSQVAATETSRNQLNERLATSLRSDLVTKYGYKEGDVKDYKLEQLELITEALAKNPGSSQTRPGQPRFNSGTNGGGGNQPVSARAKVLQAFESGEVRRIKGGDKAKDE